MCHGQHFRHIQSTIPAPTAQRKRRPAISAFYWPCRSARHSCIRFRNIAEARSFTSAATRASRSPLTTPRIAGACSVSSVFLLSQIYQQAPHEALPSCVASEVAVSSTRRPKVCSTCRTLLIWQVGLPFSRSIRKRRPVPLVIARSFCVALSCLRAARTAAPSWVVS